MNNKILIILIAAVLVLSLASTGVLLFGGNSKSDMTQGGQTNTISVSSTGEVTVLPDVGYISLGIETKNADVKKAEEENSKTMDAIMDALKKFDIEETDIKTIGYNIYPQYEEYNDEKPIAYSVNNTVEVTVKKLEDMSDIIDAAVAAGANRTNSVRFDVLDREESYNEALTNAVNNARARAEVLAEASGLKIVGVMTVNENSSSPKNYYADTMSYTRSESADGGYAPSISSGDMEISASVYITFEVANK